MLCCAFIKIQKRKNYNVMMLCLSGAYSTGLWLSQQFKNSDVGFLLRLQILSRKSDLREHPDENCNWKLGISGFPL